MRDLGRERAVAELFRKDDEEREASNKRKAEQRAAKEKQAKEKQEADFKEHSRRAYIQSGGDPLTFEVKWPELRAEIVKTKTVAAGSQYQTPAEIATDALKKLYAR